MNASTIIFRINSTILGNVLVANTPQLAISLSYFFYNTILTSMVMAAEYDGYAVASTRTTTNAEKPRSTPKKGLRVSGPREGSQRSTYWLSLPYRYSIPLLVSYTVLHWLVSESIFYVRVIMYDATQKRVPDADVNACGWSPMALVLAIAVGSLMVLALGVLSMRTYGSCIPLAGSCSAAISAACHPPRHDVNPGTKPIIWGKIVPARNSIGDRASLEMECVDSDCNGETRFPHCSFTSCDVVQPSEGQIYM